GPTFSWRAEDGGDWLVGARQLSRNGPAGGPPLPGGVVGWLGYEAGAACDRMPAPAAARDLPDVCLWRVNGAIIYDRQTMGWSVNGTAAFHEQAQQVISQACRSRSAGSPVRPSPTRHSPTPPGGQAARYQAAVRRALERIAASTRSTWHGPWTCPLWTTRSAPGWRCARPTRLVRVRCCDTPTPGC
ncbi:MAG: hypothetical protein GXP62_05435, partial [Oligoflexia bacterium]|nr:hypothetical protein [Oligoflexia bacterium]